MLKVKSIDNLIDMINSKSDKSGSAILSDYDITIKYALNKNAKSGRIFAEFEFGKKSKLEHCIIRGLVEKIAGDYRLKYQKNYDDKENYDYDLHMMDLWRWWIFSWERFGQVIAKMGPKKFGIYSDIEDSKKLASYIFDSYVEKQRPE